MIKRLIVLTAFVAAMATPVLAFHCPADMAKIDAALGAVTLPDDVLAEVNALRARGEAEHGAGNHAAAVASLADAMQMIADNS